MFKTETKPQKWSVEFENKALKDYKLHLRNKIKKLKIGESEGWDFFFGDRKPCCPGDDLSDVYNKALNDALNIIK